jgi:cysteine desulfurase family protein (TIGR01976 family)
MTFTPQQIEACRRQFPALSRHMAGMQVAYFDGPAGTQVPQRVIEAISHYLAHTNANHGGLFATSRESDHLLEQSHRGVADLLGVEDAHEVYFGQNMTSLTFALSRSLAKRWQAGDEILLTRLDHDANFTPWVLAARDAGATIKIVELNYDDGTLDMADFRRKLTSRTKLVAVGAASNATGGINPIAEIAAAAHAVGALVFVDAVHYAPHGLIDVPNWGCDFLACSAYKFFGPHIGIMWGRRALLESLEAYKVRPAPNELPGKWMTGTQSHEAIAGTLAAIDYLADLGCEASSCDGLDRRTALTAAFTHISAYEAELSRKLLAGFAALPSVKVWGIHELQRIAERVPTFSITHTKYSAHALADLLGKRGLFVWHGNYYALNLSEAWQREPQGMVRIGAVHYNTSQEIDWLLNVLGELEA